MEGGRVSEIGREHIDADAGFFPQALGVAFRPDFIASDEHKVMPTTSETFGD